MHRKYGKDGVVCLSVSVDPNEKDSRDAALHFLKKQGAVFANYLLDEDATVWGEKLDMSGPPAVFVFDRDNRRAGKFDYSDPDKQYSYDDIDRLVRQLLAK